MVAVSWKSPSVKQWVALFIFLGLSAWILPIAAENYREYKSMERAIDILAAECAKRGGCTFDTRFQY
jgi:hypothetical protein